uniref:Uncharacterized protein n=1 Tax=Arundo donax TaxID=35708 RepID=A0A0A9CUA0_ARUDO
MACNRFLVMYASMIMRREPSAEQPRTMFGGSTTSLVRITAIWSTVLIAIIIQHSSTIEDKEPPFPVTSQV